jgi:hypothetical protein
VIKWQNVKRKNQLSVALKARLLRGLVLLWTLVERLLISSLRRLGSDRMKTVEFSDMQYSDLKDILQERLESLSDDPAGNAAWIKRIKAIDLAVKTKVYRS